MNSRLIASIAGALAFLAAAPAHAVGQSVDVQVVDRSTGQVIAPVFYKGEWWIAGRPGARYGVTLLNRNGQRTLNVVSIDGVNAMSGDTAAWSQTGYVLEPYQQTEIDGWRKNMNQVAAFEFTALPDSYAARTGRSGNVGVIGIALFNERARPQPVAPRPDQGGDALRPMIAPPSPPAPTASPPIIQRRDSLGESAAKDSAGEPEVLGKATASPRADVATAIPAQRERLGTGHGDIEQSSIRYVSFERAQREPNEIVTIHYDRVDNLIAMGILPPSAVPRVAVGPSVNPFPNSVRFVADPPPRR